MPTKQVRIVLECSPIQSKKGKLKSFEGLTDMQAEGFESGENELETVCATHALERAVAEIAVRLRIPVEEYLRNFTDDVIRLYCSIPR